MNTKDIQTFIETLLSKLSVEFDGIEVQTEDDSSATSGQTVFQITTTKSGLLIGNRGETIRALNHVVKKAFDNADEGVRFIVDVNGYHTKKIEDLKQTAKLLADRARSLKYNVEMTPMSSYERMIVHAALTDEPNIMTESYGEGRDRRVVIKYSDH